MASLQTTTKCTELLRKAIEVWQQFYPERKGFSLAVQEDALRNFATREGEEIVKQFRIAETANTTDAPKLNKSLTVCRHSTWRSKSF